MSAPDVCHPDAGPDGVRRLPARPDGERVRKAGHGATTGAAGGTDAAAIATRSGHAEPAGLLGAGPAKERR